MSRIVFDRDLVGFSADSRGRRWRGNPIHGRQGKRPDGGWSDVSEGIEIFRLPLDTLCWRFQPKAQ